MSTTFMTPGELAELTGFRAPHCQVRWLDRNRWRYALDRNSRPKVAREYFGERMGVRASLDVNQVNQAATLEQPNFAALDRL